MRGRGRGRGLTGCVAGCCMVEQPSAEVVWALMKVRIQSRTTPPHHMLSRKSLHTVQKKLLFLDPSFLNVLSLQTKTFTPLLLRQVQTAVVCVSRSGLWPSPELAGLYLSLSRLSTQLSGQILRNSKFFKTQAHNYSLVLCSPSVHAHNSMAIIC